MNLLILFLIVLSSSSWSDESQQKAATCVACHGPAGVSVNNLWPNLAGQKEDYLVKQLKAFRDGVRIDPLMSPVSRMLSENDIKELASYFANAKGAQ